MKVREQRLNNLLLLGGLSQVIAGFTLVSGWMTDMVRLGALAGGAAALAGLLVLTYAISKLHFTIKSLAENTLWILLTSGVVVLATIPVLIMGAALRLFWWGFAIALIWAVTASMRVVTHGESWRWRLNATLRTSPKAALFDKRRQRQMSRIGAWISIMSLLLWVVLLFVGWRVGVVVSAAGTLVAGLFTYLSLFGVLPHYTTRKECETWEGNALMSGAMAAIGLGLTVGSVDNAVLGVITTVVALGCFITVAQRQREAMRI
ncbi:MAG TPA: hypothetical protein VLA88_06745 [Candidatus Saccharimonadales bacterium]|nr:hypothetical protein [Candidatus Saccharimonadales bacterium]